MVGQVFRNDNTGSGIAVKDANQTVTYKRIDNISKITSGSIKIILLQMNQYPNEIKGSEVTVGLYNDKGNYFHWKFFESKFNCRTNPKSVFMKQF
jgi:hypothetical protein